MTRINEISNILLYLNLIYRSYSLQETPNRNGVQWENVWNRGEWENEIWMENSIIGSMEQRIENFSHKENYFLFFFCTLWRISFALNEIFLFWFVFCLCSNTMEQFHNYYRGWKCGRFFVRKYVVLDII